MVLYNKLIDSMQNTKINVINGNRSLYKAIKSEYVILLAFLVPLFICLLICVIKGVYPFGNKCLLTGDLATQYYPFFTEFYNKIHNLDNFMYSWNIGLGSDFIEIYAYYLASPLNWLIYFCPKNLIIEFMTLLILVKIALSGMFFYIFLKNTYTFDNEYKYIALIFSTAYAMCGFVSAYSINIMWLDGLALAPLIVLGLRNLVFDNDVILYYISLSICILANYYVAMIICIFLVLYFFLLLSQQRNSRIKIISRFVLFSLLACGTGAMFLLPVINVLGYTNTYGNEFPSAIEWYFNLFKEIERMFVLSKSNLYDMRLPNLYSGSFSILLISLFLLNKNINNKEKISNLILLVFILLSFSCNYLDYIWHGLRFPTYLPGRQAFLFSFLIISISFSVVLEIKKISNWQIFDSVVISLIFLTAAFVANKNDVSLFKSYLATILFILTYALCIFAIKSKLIKNKKTFSIVICAIALAELSINMTNTGFQTSNRDDYINKISDYKEILRLADNDSNGEFYRIESTVRKTNNDSALYGYPGASIFSSLSNINVSYFNEKAFMECGGNFYGFRGATPLISSLLSLDYLITDSPDYLDDYRTLIGNIGDLYLFKNNYRLPFGFLLNEENIEQYEKTSEIKFKGLNALAKAFGSKDDYLLEANYDMSIEKGCTKITVNESGYYYVCYAVCTDDQITAVSTNGIERKFLNTKNPYLMELGYYEEGDVISLKNEGKQEINYALYKLNQKSIDDIFTNLNEQTIQIDVLNNNCFSGYVEVNSAGRLVLPIVNEEGWSVYVDGVREEKISFSNTFISINLEKGNHKIELSYRTPLLNEGLTISVLSILIFTSCMLNKKNMML